MSSRSSPMSLYGMAAAARTLSDPPRNWRRSVSSSWLMSSSRPASCRGTVSPSHKAFTVLIPGVRLFPLASREIWD